MCGTCENAAARCQTVVKYGGPLADRLDDSELVDLVVTWMDDFDDSDSWLSCADRRDPLLLLAAAVRTTAAFWRALRGSPGRC